MDGDIGRRAVDGAVNFEAKKDGLRQVQEGDWKLTLTVHDLPPNIMQHAMGQRYQVVVVAIDDNEEPIQPKTPPRGWRILKASQRAGILCQRADFWGYMGARDEPEAARKLRNLCHVNSRADLDSDADANSIFGELQRRFFDHINRPPDEVYQ